MGFFESRARTPLHLAVWAVTAVLAVAQLALHVHDGDTLGAWLAAALLACCVGTFVDSFRHHRRARRADARAGSPR